MSLHRKNAVIIYFLLIMFVQGIIMSGCTITMGSKFDDGMITHIKSGITTQSQVLELLGPPESEGLKDDLPLWTYLFVEIKIIGGTAKGMALTIEFDESELVKSYSYVPY